MILIVDYGLGNLGSIVNMFKRLGIGATVSSSRDDVERATRLVLPGVGSFDHGIKNLRSLDLIGPLNERIAAGVPVLGICLGAQLMTRGSEEGTLPGLGWIPVDTMRFRVEKCERPIKVPHMGWTDVVVAKTTPLFPAVDEPQRFYFVHSYHFVCNEPSDVLTTSSYGYEFASAFARGAISGVQFHPEKSHRFGMKLLQRFAEMSP